MRFQNPTRRQLAIKLGDMVQHRRKHGLGKVVANWGSWKSCPNCYLKTDAIGEERYMGNKRKMRTRKVYPVCDYCHKPVDFPINVASTQVVEVKFETGTYPINKVWLTPLT